MQHRLVSVAALMLLSSVAFGAADLTESDAPASAVVDDGPGWVRAWTRVTEEAKASQPHFVAPIVTTHVMLVQQFRYDMAWQRDPSGGTITSNYGASRGLEIIPSSRLEVGIFPPGYIVHQTNVPDGFGDLSYQVKYRIASATEGKGDYFVGFFFGGTVPTSKAPNGLGHAVLSPTFAAAKGLGPWDIQSTIGATLPTSGTNVLGRALLFNTEVDYRIKGKIWPMLEQNSTFWLDGPLNGTEASVRDSRPCVGGISSDWTPCGIWRRRTDCFNVISSVQSSLDLFDPLSLLTNCHPQRHCRPGDAAVS